MSLVIRMTIISYASCCGIILKARGFIDNRNIFTKQLFLILFGE
jgi:hypothetical protein